MIFCEVCGDQLAERWNWCSECQITLCPSCSKIKTRVYAEESEPCTHVLQERTKHDPTVAEAQRDRERVLR